MSGSRRCSDSRIRIVHCAFSCRRRTAGLVVTTIRWFLSLLRSLHWFRCVCDRGALCPCARRLCGSKSLQEPGCAPVELGDWLNHKRGPEVVRYLVVSRRNARPFVSITRLGLRENGRPSLVGT